MSNAEIIPKDLTGWRFGRLVVTGLTRYNKTREVTEWECRCDCGEVRMVARYSLVSGKAKSCGCLHRDIVRDKQIQRNVDRGARFLQNRLKEFPGKRFDRLIVNKLADGDISNRSWLCDCECGGSKVVAERFLIDGSVRSCGCLKHEHRNVPDLVGKRVGRLLVVDIHDKDSTNNIRWLCRCDCGNTCTPRTTALVLETTLSCGCLGREVSSEVHTTHGMSDSPEYESWRAMRRRCNDPGAGNYKHYGAKGITVCDQWNKSFEAFYKDMGQRPLGTTLDRENPKGNYEPGNCRWADPFTQSFNQGPSVKNTSGVVGVQQRVNQWVATLRYRGEEYLQRSFDSFDRAVQARKRAEEDVAFLESPEGQGMIEEMFTSSTDDIPFD